MDNKNLRVIYDTFLDSGELMLVMPEAKGIWEKDKLLFTTTYSNLDDSILHCSDEDLDEEDPYVEDDYYY